MSRPWVWIEGGLAGDCSDDVIVLDMDILEMDPEHADEGVVDEVQFLLEKAEEADVYSAVKRARSWLEERRSALLKPVVRTSGTVTINVTGPLESVQTLESADPSTVVSYLRAVSCTESFRITGVTVAVGEEEEDG